MVRSRSSGQASPVGAKKGRVRWCATRAARRSPSSIWQLSSRRVTAAGFCGSPFSRLISATFCMLRLPSASRARRRSDRVTSSVRLLVPFAALAAPVGHSSRPAMASAAVRTLRSALWLRGMAQVLRRRGRAGSWACWTSGHSSSCPTSLARTRCTMTAQQVRTPTRPFPLPTGARPERALRVARRVLLLFVRSPSCPRSKSRSSAR